MSYLDEIFDLKSKVVIVTGACGQLGNTICDSFKKSGSTVYGLDINVDTNKINGVEYFSIDITNKLELIEIFESIIAKHKKIDVLINNAGVSTFENFEKRSEEDFDWVMDTNLKGTFFCIQSFVNLFDSNKLKKASIINIGSIFGVVSPDFRNYTDLPRKSPEIYGASKAGVIQMTKYFSVHLAERNIRVNCVSPGGIFNPKNPQGKGFVENYSFRVPMKRMAEQSEMVGAILYLASSAASYTTGQNILIDGGLTSW